MSLAPFTCRARLVSFPRSGFDSLYFLHCHISNILLNENKTGYETNHRWKDGAKNKRTFVVAKSKVTFQSLLVAKNES